MPLTDTRAHVLALALACAWVSVARADPPRRVLVLGEVSAVLLERIRGQTADLPFTLEPRPEVRVDAGVLASALLAGEAQAAPLVVSVEEHADGAVSISIIEVAQRRLFARRIEAPHGETWGASAMAEAAALVIRSALSDLAQGGHLGVVVPVVEEPQVRDVVEVAEDDASEAPPTSASLPLRVLGAFGVGIALDGMAPLANLGVAGGLALDLGLVEVALGAHLGIPANLVSGPVELSLSRVGVHAGVGIELIDVSMLRVVLGVEGGAVLVIRQSRALDPALEATAATTLLVPGGALSLRAWITPLLAELDFPLGLYVELAADVTPTAPSFVVDVAGERTEAGAMWPVQPRAVLGIALRSQ